MKYFELTQEEEQILKDFEDDKFESHPKISSAKNAYREYARETLNKAKNINIRLSEKDLYKLKSKAVSLGIPYQTLVTSILHKAASEENCR
ncbi:MAG: hypothetical protein UT63_C0056G0016 [Candidatus Gottesmanbacteria bacterium GW2011_GWC2_39_8]|uniref:Antitoxin n=1 Tax=Candidatus Gottesmanbacteria bacterium GW2011_GWC2_39_8 TaxID=1618450 RepID=A0A0G0T276_9BACT|nr:MAG: hypothetical protein UT63_C0056G0016 [Candidatus Gottesmanbacteria bacterium GW2011_GWC2_39_8]